MNTKNSFLHPLALLCALFLILYTSLIPCLSYAQPCDGTITKQGCPGVFGAPTGAVFEFNESFLTDAIRNAWDANGLGSPRGAFFLGDPATDTDDDLDGYVKTEPLAIVAGFGVEDYRRRKWSERLPGWWDDIFNHDDNYYPEDDDNMESTWWSGDDYLYLPLGDVSLSM